MKTCLLRMAATLVVAILLFPLIGNAATTTTLLSQDFSSASFPPSGWSANIVWNGGYYSQPGWTRSNGGATGADGSAVAWTMWARSERCYGSSYGPITLTSPAVSGFASSDSQYLDFDLYMPQNYYEQFYGQMGVQLTISDGAKVVKTLKTGDGQHSDGTYYDYQYGFRDPSGYSGSYYWRHYHLTLPGGVSSHQIKYQVDMLYGSCYYSYWYTDDIAIDNVAITNVHYDVLTMLGPANLNFGQIPYLQTSQPEYIRFVNNSTRTITLSNFAITGLDTGDFHIVYAPSSVAVGVEDSVGVTYTPQASGQRAANLSFNTDADAPTTANIPLTGFGLRPYISLPPFVYSMFSHQHIRFGAMTTATLMVSNTGLVPLHISPASYIDGDFGQMYTIVHIPPSIGPDQTDSIVLSFQPTIEGLMSATLHIVSDANNGTQLMPLKGIGILARLAVDNAYQNNISVNLDSVAVGSSSCSNVTLYNPGSDTLAIEKNFFSSADYDFSMTPLTGTDTLIAPNTSKTIQVCFTPLKRGYRTAQLRIVTNIPLTYDNPRQDTSQFSVLFAGTGVPSGNFFITAPDGVDSIEVSKTGCQTDTMWNTGEADLTVTKLMVDDTSEFLVTPPTLPFVLAAGSHETFTVCATPSMMNDRTATVTGIAMNGEKMDTATQPQDVYGISNCTSDSVTSAFPAMTCIGDTAMQTVMVTNCGNVATAYTAAITGANAADFAIVGSPTSSTESAGGTASFTVAFHPTTNTAENAMLSITGGAGAAVVLTANGSAATIAGSGTAPMTAVGSSNNFTVTVNNTGSCDWTPGTPTVTAPFSYVSGGTTPIAANGSGTLTFSFNPTSAGTFTQPVTFPQATGMSIPAANVSLSGTTESAGVDPAVAKNGYRLDQNYPNPFANTSEVEITLPESANVRLVLVDMKGETVQSILDQHMAAGSYEIKLDASNIASGTYYYQMTAGSVTLTRQMEVVK